MAHQVSPSPAIDKCCDESILLREPVVASVVAMLAPLTCGMEEWGEPHMNIYVSGKFQKEKGDLCSSFLSLCQSHVISYHAGPPCFHILPVSRRGLGMRLASRFLLSKYQCKVQSPQCRLILRIAICTTGCVCVGDEALWLQGAFPDTALFGAHPPRSHCRCDLPRNIRQLQPCCVS